MRPEHGVRFELRLGEANESGVVYRVRVAMATAEHQGSARIDLPSGQLALELSAEPLAPDVEQTLRALLRGLFRAQQGGGEWPRRVTRWRNESAA